MILLYHWLREKNTHFFFCENWMVLHLRRFLHFVNVFWLFLNYLPLAWLFIGTKLNPHHPKMFCVKFGWNWPSCSFFLKSMYFCYFIIISLWKRVWFYILTNWNPLHLRMLCAKFLNFVNVFSLNINYLPLEKGVTLYYSKLEVLSSRDALCQVWLKWAPGRRWKCKKFIYP